MNNILPPDQSMHTIPAKMPPPDRLSTFEFSETMVVVTAWYRFNSLLLT